MAGGQRGMQLHDQFEHVLTLSAMAHI